GILATVAGGYLNTASGAYSFAAGTQANAIHDGAFVWADAQAVNFNSAAVNEFAVRASGGVRLRTNGSNGCDIAPGGGTWDCTSDRNAKENFSPVDTSEILQKVAALPMETWNYKTQDDSIRHIGPMAQDFRAAFGLGENDTTISTVDSDGVALAAIQGLYRLAEAQRMQLQIQQKRLETQQEQIQGLQAENRDIRAVLLRVQAHLTHASR
ncbi:MAG: peptidase S74, partial [Gammaproteobacteria bacterium]|nr:peptidase S74 [Gammaproteobacteria bacterium]